MGKAKATKPLSDKQKIKRACTKEIGRIANGEASNCNKPEDIAQAQAALALFKGLPENEKLEFAVGFKNKEKGKAFTFLKDYEDQLTNKRNVKESINEKFMSRTPHASATTCMHMHIQAWQGNAPTLDRQYAMLVQGM